jgi:choline kinase
MSNSFRIYIPRVSISTTEENVSFELGKYGKVSQVVFKKHPDNDNIKSVFVYFDYLNEYFLDESEDVVYIQDMVEMIDNDIPFKHYTEENEYWVFVKNKQEERD